MDACDPHRVIYEWAGVRYSKAVLEHKLLGKRGLNIDSARWLLNDELINALALAIQAETPSETTGVLTPYMLSAMFGMGATPPRHQTVLDVHFARKSRQAGVMFLPPCHWIFVCIEVRPEYLAVQFVDSLDTVIGDQVMKPLTLAFARRYFPKHLELGRLRYVYTQAARQVNPFDCGILALDALSRVLNNQALPSNSYGRIPDTAPLRVSMCRLLEKYGRRLSVEEVNQFIAVRTSRDDEIDDVVIVREGEEQFLPAESAVSAPPSPRPPPHRSTTPMSKEEEDELLTPHIASIYSRPTTCIK